MNKDKIKKIVIGEMDKHEIINEIVTKIVIPLMILIVVFCVFLGGCNYDPIGVEIRTLESQNEQTCQGREENQNSGHSSSPESDHRTDWHISGN